VVFILLTVYERITLLNILPKEGDFTTLKIVRQLRESLSFSEKEHKELSFKGSGDKLDDGSVVPQGRIMWNVNADKPKEILLGEKAKDIIADRLKELDKQKKLTEAHFSLYEKFIGGE
jgi:hypothetical protein